MLDGGQVLRNGPLTGLTDTNVVEIEVVEDAARLATELTAHGATVESHGNVVIMREAPGDPFLLARDVLAATGVVLRRMGARSTTLEDIFLGEAPPDG